MKQTGKKLPIERFSILDPEKHSKGEVASLTRAVDMTQKRKTAMYLEKKGANI